MNIDRYQGESGHKMRILRHIFLARAVSRAELAAELKLSPATITKFVTMLLQDGVVEEGAALESTGGRKPLVLHPNARAGSILAVDIGAWFTRIAVVDFALDIRHFEVFRTDGFTPGMLPDKLCEVMKSASGQTIMGIAIGISGMVDHRNGRVLFCPNIPDWNDTSLQMQLENELGLPVRLDTSARLMALAEGRMGVGEGTADQVTVSIGYGIGAGLVFGGRLFYGHGGHAGELGHVQVDENGTKCTCGNVGCLENYVTFPLILEHVQDKMSGFSGYSPLKQICADPAQLTGLDMKTALAQGDKIVREELEATGKLIGVALANMANMINPGRIILAGGVIETFPELADIAARTVRERSLTPVQQDLVICRSRLSDKGALLGGALMLIDLFLQLEAT